MAIYNDYQHPPVWKRLLKYHYRHLRVLKMQLYDLIGPAMASLMLGSVGDSGLPGNQQPFAFRLCVA